MHDDNEEQKEKDTGPDLKVSSMFSTKSKSQVEPLTPKGRQQKMERKKTNPPNLLTRVVGCVSSPLSQRLEAAVDCRQTPDNWTAHILRDHSQSLVWHRVIKVNMPSCSGNRNLPGKIKLTSKPHKKTLILIVIVWLTGNPPNLNTCARNPTKPQPRVFLVSAGLATRPSHWQLASQPEHRAVRYPKVPGLTFQRFWTSTCWVGLRGCAML